MARTKAQKQEVIEKVRVIADGAKSLVFVNIHGVKVSDLTLMRRTMKKDGVGFFVAKKTLSLKALGDNKYTGTMPPLAGEFALAYGTDLVAPARGVHEFEKKFKGQVSIQGGVFESKFMSKEEMNEIALIPSQKTLYGMFVNVINSPIQGFVMVLDALSKKTS